MYQEEIANLTADHLRTHLTAYLAEVQARYNDAVKMQFPKSIQTDNLVGGVYNAAVGNMPAYAIDVITKAFAGENINSLWLYNYEGHIAGIVSAQGEVAANKLAKRHEQVVETFVKQHEFMHQTQSALGNDFRLQGLGFAGAGFSGAEMIDEENDRQTWIAGFRVDLLWVVSENGPGQHG